MPTVFSHAIIGSALAKIAERDTPQSQTVIACALLAMLPDADGIFFGIIPYGHLFGHRGFTHSLLFAVLAGCLTALLFVWQGWIERAAFGRYALLFAVTTASHGVLDAFTSGGLGVAFFAPFDTTRYFFPWRPIPVSPMSAGALLSARGWRVITGEFMLLWMLALAVWLWERRVIWRCGIALLCASVGIWAWLR